MKKVILTLVFVLGITTLAYAHHGGGHRGYYGRDRGYDRGRGGNYSGGGYYHNYR